MKNELQVFNNPEFGQVRTLVVDNEPYFVGKDVAEILGYSDAFGALKKHVDAEDKQNCQNGSFESPRGMTVINESGLYSLILSSKLPAAKKFKRWVTSEVLPSIRKHGAYMTSETIEDVLLHPDTLIKLAQNLKEEQEKRKAAEAQVEADRPKVVFADSVSVSKTSILIGDLAKILKQNNIDVGQKRLFHWLRENSYLIKRKGAEYNSPTQRAMEKGLFEIKETVITHADGHTSISKTTKVTGKGQIYFVNKFLAEKGEAA
jgi:prophage antirepressor|nr:MAG TPA: repressor domain protein [Caudoviricetes sp.]